MLNPLPLIHTEIRSELIKYTCLLHRLSSKYLSLLMLLVHFPPSKGKQEIGSGIHSAVFLSDF